MRIKQTAARRKPEEAYPSSSSNTSDNEDGNSQQTAPPPKKRMTLEAAVPVAQEKQPKPVNKQPMDVLMQDLDEISTTLNQIKEGMAPIIKRIEKHGTNNFIVINEFAEKMKEISEKTSALKALMPNSVINIQPTRKRIHLTIKNCRELFSKDEFSVQSTSIELIGFKWYLLAKIKEKGFLALYLHAEPPDGFEENYRIEVDWRFSILNIYTNKDLIEDDIGCIYTLDDNENDTSGFGWGCAKMAKFEDLLDPSQTFLNPDGDIETSVEFTIKSSTLDHLT